MPIESSGGDTKYVKETSYEGETKVDEVLGNLLRGGNNIILPFR